LLPAPHQFFCNSTNVLVRIYKGRNEVWCGFVKGRRVLVGDDRGATDDDDIKGK